MAVEFEISDTIPASAKDIYTAWLDSEGHTRMTGSPAQSSDRVGETFTAWDGYIYGVNLELDPGKRILQSWRTSEFPPGAEDSRVEIRFDPVQGGTRITIHHSHLPQDGLQYKQGWLEFYFQPMQSYFKSSTRRG